MKLRWKLLAIFIPFFIGPLLLISVMHWKVKREVESYKQRLLAGGEKLTIAEWIPRSSTNGNAARVFLDSVRPFSGLSRDRHPSMMRMVAVGRAQASWQSEEIYDSDFKRRTNIWEMIRADFEGNAEALADLRDSTENGELVFPVAYAQGFRALLPHLAPVKQGFVWLLAATIFELHKGSKEDAIENLKAALRLLKNYEGEPFLISHLVRIAYVNIALSTTWEVLQYPNWTDGELKELQEAWSAIEFENLEATFSMERAMGIQMMAEARETGEDPLDMNLGGSNASLLDDLNEFTAEVMKDPKAALKALFNQPRRKTWKWVKSYRDELSLLTMWQTGLEANRQIERQHFYQPTLRTLMLKSKEQGADEGFLMGDAVSLATKTQQKACSAKIARGLAIAACALQRFKLETGHYPTGLQELMPELLTAIPLDPIDGQPLHYQLNADGTFLLYSVGENGVDDGGDSTPENISTDQKWIRPRHPLYGRDWVWPLVATEEQITEWEQHESGAAK